MVGVDSPVKTVCIDLEARVAKLEATVKKLESELRILKRGEKSSEDIWYR